MISHDISIGRLFAIIVVRMAKEIDYQVTDLVEFDGYGSLHLLNLLTKDFLDMGYELTDVVEVSFLDKKIMMPVVKDFNYIDLGYDGLTLSNMEANYIKLISFGDLFVQKYGLAEPDDSGSHPWKLKEGLSFPINIHIKLHQKYGYKKEYEILSLDRTNNRGDYDYFSDYQFANFREVESSKLKEHILYRASSPIDPQLKRHLIVDKAMEEAGIKTIINVVNHGDLAKQFYGYENTYYSKQNILFAPAPIYFFGDRFNSVVVKMVKYMISHDGPYLIHCWEGKDRTGYLVAILLCLIGASREEIVKDYIESYVNFFKISKGSETYFRIALRIYHMIQKGFGVNDFYNVDLSKEAYDYLVRIGLAKEEIDRLIAILSK